MKKINIIKEAKEFEKIIRYRHLYRNRYFVMYIINKSMKYYRFGISIPKKVGNSVVRNKLKRQIKSIVDQNKNINKNYDYVIIIKKEILELKYNEMVDQLDKLLNKVDGECQNEKI